MKKTAIISAVTLFCLLAGRPLLTAGWNVIDLGTGGSASNVMYGVAAGAGRNDGVIRLYGANANSHLYEFSFAGGTWHTADLGGTATNNMIRVAVGNGRNDGVIRVYGANADGHVYEFTYSGAAWSKVDLGLIGASAPAVNGIVIGAGRNDAVNRIYLACSDDHVYEYTYSAGWVKTDLGTAGSSSSMYRVALGAGQNDGVTRIYASNADSHIYEFTYSGGWTGANLGNGTGSMSSAAVGNGRNDGVMRVFGANSDGHVYEYSFVTSTWTAAADMGSGTLSPTVYSMQGVLVDNGRNDGVSRVYAADADAHLYEFSYAASAWSVSDMGASGSYMEELTSAAGRNDGVIRIYAANYDYHVYELTYTTSTSVTANNSNNSLGNTIIYPTFANLSKGDKISFLNVTPAARINVISPAGHVIKSLQADANGVVAPWDGSIEGGGKAASGTYIVHASDGKGNNKVFKILLIK